MKIRIFELERVQSIYENTVEFNLTESGFHPLKLNSFLSPSSWPISRIWLRFLDREEVLSTGGAEFDWGGEQQRY